MAPIPQKTIDGLINAVYLIADKINVFTIYHPYLTGIPVVIFGARPLLFLVRTIWGVFLYMFGFEQSGVRRDSLASDYQRRYYGSTGLNIDEDSYFAYLQSAGTRYPEAEEDEEKRSVGDFIATFISVAFQIWGGSAEVFWPYGNTKKGFTLYVLITSPGSVPSLPIKDIGWTAEECTPTFFDLLDFLLRVPSLVHAFTEEYPYLSAIIIVLIGLEPVLFCTKTLWEGLMYHLGCHPLTFRPGSVAWRIRPRRNRAFAQVRAEAIIVAFD
ncbi:uncharacterized protein STEHIDRAFT_152280 [Stereum hirsutum FP-91666 SS1]|uniref:uncharacterized protein n=1 Tax=Stereum hirsutum (strain FP-91666) TaxID=721885 RepID=UPI000440DBF0|nr:uncharacterized protein STEHIDRAFT_152280 [Stereum hirsutum FP-91666 SS1]EIM90563.1 hypothetical protein STEHIDRAFT_152280 [Stereum hirsutum FP-91666 SS1]